MVREISSECNGESLTWLLLIICIDVYGEKEQQVRKKTKKNVQFGEKRELRCLSQFGRGDLASSWISHPWSPICERLN